jgi:hypothetical protein
MAVSGTVNKLFPPAGYRLVLIPRFLPATTAIIFGLRTLDGVTYLSADGDGGNFINIFPDQDMVVVFTQGLYLKWPTYVNQADDMMKNYIFPVLN